MTTAEPDRRTDKDRAADRQTLEADRAAMSRDNTPEHLGTSEEVAIRQGVIQRPYSRAEIGAAQAHKSGQAQGTETAHRAEAVLARMQLRPAEHDHTVQVARSSRPEPEHER